MATIPRSYLTVNEVMLLLGCGANKAYRIMRQINKESEQNGYIGFVSGKVNKHLFAEKLQIPEKEIEAAIEYIANSGAASDKPDSK